MYVIWYYTLSMSQYLMSNGEEDISVKRVCEQSDLGVLFTLNFKFGSHIYYIAQKASQLISLIKIHLNVWMHLCYKLYTQV